MKLNQRKSINTVFVRENRSTLCSSDDVWNERGKVHEFNGKHSSHLSLHTPLPSTVSRHRHIRRLSISGFGEAQIWHKKRIGRRKATPPWMAATQSTEIQRNPNVGKDETVNFTTVRLPRHRRALLDSDHPLNSTLRNHRHSLFGIRESERQRERE